MTKAGANFIRLLLVGFLLSGCANQLARNLAPPETMDLDRALIDTIDAVYLAEAHARDKDKIGMYLDQTTIEYNISIKEGGTDGGSLQVASLPIPAGTIGGQIGSSLVSEGNKGNKITIVFKNVATLPKEQKDNVKVFYSYPTNLSAEIKKAVDSALTDRDTSAE